MVDLEIKFSQVSIHFYEPIKLHPTNHEQHCVPEVVERRVPKHRQQNAGLRQNEQQRHHRRQKVILKPVAHLLDAGCLPLQLSRGFVQVGV